jgi:gliding motility-associated-like protein
MKRYLTFALLILCYAGNGQNLVPNPSFEDLNNCPVNHTNIDYSPGYNIFPYVQAWVSPTESTPDYYNICATGTAVDVPGNLFGYQVPHTGVAYTGMYYWISGQDYREYLQTKLTSPMIAGRQYYVSMYYSLSAPGFATGIWDIVGIYSIGMHISATHTTQLGINPMTLVPQITQPTGQYVTDTGAWVKVKGLYTATGGEEWLTIGNFHLGPNVPYTTVINEPDTLYMTYSYMDDVSVTMIKDTIVNVHDTVACGQNFPMTLIAPVRPTDIALWNTGDTTANLVVNSSGTYWKYSWNDTAMFVDSFHISAPTVSNPTLDLGPDTSFCGNSYTISANGSYLSYSWNTGATTSSITVTSSGQYILNVTDSCGSNESDTVNVTLKPTPPPPGTDDTTVCRHSNVDLSATGQNLLWYTDSTAAGNATPPIINTSNTGIQTVYVTQNMDGCRSAMAAIHIIVTDMPVPNGNIDTSICNNHSISIGKAQANAYFLWSTGSTECCITINQPGQYSVMISNSCGSVADTATLTTFNCVDCVLAPTAFSPNEDGRNDKYGVITRCPLRKFQLSIFNRFGELVYDSTDPSERWDGKYKTDIVDLGVYYFYIKYTPDIPNAKEELLKGDITVLR